MHFKAEAHAEGTTNGKAVEITVTCHHAHLTLKRAAKCTNAQLKQIVPIAARLDLEVSRTVLSPFGIRYPVR